MTDEQPRDVRYVLRLPEDLRDDAKAKAHRKDRSLAQVLREFLRHWLREPNGPPGEGEG